MKAKELIKELKGLIKIYGDLPVYYLDSEDEDREAEVAEIEFTTISNPQFFIV